MQSGIWEIHNFVENNYQCNTLELSEKIQSLNTIIKDHNIATSIYF